MGAAILDGSVGDVDLDDANFGYFHEHGARGLLLSMMKQSLQDFLVLKKNPGIDDPDGEIAASANWLSTDVGQEGIAFLMPGIHPSRFVAKVYTEGLAEQVLAAIKGSDESSSGDRAIAQGFQPTEMLVDAAVWADVTRDEHEHDRQEGDCP